jgi:hypothetical protein
MYAIDYSIMNSVKGNDPAMAFLNITLKVLKFIDPYELCLFHMQHPFDSTFDLNIFVLSLHLLEPWYHVDSHSFFDFLSDYSL